MSTKIRNWTATASGDILGESGAVIFHRAPLSPERSFQEAKEDAQFVATAGKTMPALVAHALRVSRLLEIDLEIIAILSNLVPDGCECPARLDELLAEAEKIANEAKE